MRVIFFTRYTRKGASSRLRTFQYIDFLEANGISCQVSPLFSDEYLEEVYRSKTHNKWQAAKSFITRLYVLTGVYRYDKVVIEKELFPFLPSVVEWILYQFNIGYIVDYDDAVFHNYDIHPNGIIRAILGRKIQRVMKYASLVVAGNAYIREYAVKVGSRNIKTIPTVIDLARYKPTNFSQTNVFTIGWIGSPITFKYMVTLKQALEELSSRYDVIVKLIGADKLLGLENGNELLLPWSENHEVEQIQSFDVGVMPMEDNIWERGKCGYKLIQYMGCGVPIVGTPIGVNRSIIQDGLNGFSATTDAEWLRHLEYLITHPAERKVMGERGRVFVESHFALQVFQQQWLAILQLP
jgi:glycosyltransferase involved in cell wall biosynthesis